jgi:hypothetical protein
VIITDALKVVVVVALEYEEDPHAIEGISDRAAKAVVRLGEDHGAFIRQESIYRSRGKMDEQTMRIPYSFFWFPDPSEGVEFRGGPNDGKTVPVPRQKDGRPPESIVLAEEYRRPEISSDEIPALASSARYTRAGIDSEKDRWVYTYDD